MSNRDNSSSNSLQLQQPDDQQTSVVEIRSIPRQDVADIFRTRSNEISDLLQQKGNLSNKLISKAIPMIVYAIANADDEIDSKEIASFQELFRFQTAVQIFRSEILLAFFRVADGRQALADVGSLKYLENSRHRTDVFSELDAIFDELFDAIGNEDRDRLRDDILNLCFIVANASGGIFEFESNISKEEKYAASKIKAIIDRNFGYSQGGKSISIPNYLADHIEKFTDLFQSEFKASASQLEIAVFAISVCEFFMEKYTNPADRAGANQLITEELTRRFNLDAKSIAEKLRMRSPVYIAEMLISLRSLQEGQVVEDINDSMNLAMLFHKNATGLDRVDAFVCLTVLAPEMISFALETAGFVSEVLSRKEDF